MPWVSKEAVKRLFTSFRLAPLNTNPPRAHHNATFKKLIDLKKNSLQNFKNRYKQYTPLYSNNNVYIYPPAPIYSPYIYKS
jgi:hypothetical protein